MEFEKWWQNEMNLRKCLLILLVLFVISVLFGVLLWGTHVPPIELCTDPECVRISTHILDSIDSSVDPCDNFYNFACGGFLKNTFSLGQPTTLHYLKELMKNKLKEIVVETTDERNLSKALKMQRKFYRTCMDDAAIEEDKDCTFLRLLDLLVGGWPVLKGDQWNETDFEWSKSVVKAKNLGLYHQFYFRLELHLDDSGVSNVLSVKPPHEKDVSTFYLQSQHLHLIHETALHWGAAHDSKTIDELRKTMRFAQQLEQIVRKFYNKTPENKPNTTGVIALGDLDHKLFKLNWTELLTNILGVQLEKDHLVLFDVEDYLTDLYYVLLMKTPKRTQANYMSWAVISTNLNYLSKKVRDKYKKITKRSNDKSEYLNRSELCYKASRKLFEHVAEAEYIRRYTPPAKREYIKDIIKSVKRNMRDGLQKFTWMDEITKRHAIDDLENITVVIGGTDVVYHVDKFERTFGYEDLRGLSNKLINMKREVTINRIDHYYKRFLRKEKAVFLDAPRLDVYPYNNRYLKKLVLPTALVQGQIFDEKRPHYVNYASLGRIIGHELTHALMVSNLSGELAWWTNNTRRKFRKIGQCLTDEYGLYPEKLTGFNKNGLEVEENFVDFSGVNFAHAAYQEWVSKNSQEESLPGLKYTPNQIFWIMTSTHLCLDPQLAKMKIHSMHSVPSFRVIGPLRNSPYFARDFNCPVGSRMNPQNKCRIYT